MQISSRRLLVEGAVGTAGVLAAVALVARVPHLGWGALRPHPIWLVVLALSARYGARGLLVAMPVAWGTLALIARPWRSAPSEALAALATPAELGALVAAITVGWIASVHERRSLDLEEKVQALMARSTHDSASLAELRRAALALRSRNDRLDLALTFLRDVARRIDGGDLGAAAEAALALVLARLGARAGAVETRSADGTLAILAAAGAWDPTQPPGNDATVEEALQTGQAVRAIDLPGAGPGDSDLAAPIVVGGETVGALTVRGVARVGAAALRDLVVVAEWLATAFARARSRRGIERGDRPGGSALNV
jgi:hypothetical protein